MKERPILFSGAMVRAILSGGKTQTRRVVKTVKSLPDGRGWDGVRNLRTGSHVPLTERGLEWSPYGGAPMQAYPHGAQCCPYGEPGDRLWVRETHFEARRWRHAPVFAAAPDFIYRADYEYREELASVIGCHHWKPSSSMKREASRITLEIVSVRVERLQDISEADAMAEGVKRDHLWDRWNSLSDRMTYDGCGETFDNGRQAYCDLWQKINGAGSWDSNPWVWVVEFKRL